MATEKPGVKRPLSEVEEAGSLTLEERIAQQITDNPDSVRPTAKKARVEERRSIFVRSLPADVTNESLTDFFSEYFPVKHATVITDQKTKQSRGYGFVTFADAEDAQQAKVALDKKQWNGRSIRVDIAEPRHRNGTAITEAPAGKPKKEEFAKPPKLIVRNLPWSIKTSEQLSNLFRSFGKVKFADLPMSKGKLRGFGFVTIRGKKNAEKAVESINGKEIDGRTLAVDYAVDKNTWEEQQQSEKPEAPEDEDDETSSEGEDSDEDEEEDGEKDKADGKPQTKDKELDDDLKNFFKNHMQNMEDEDEDDDENKDEDEDEDEEDGKDDEDDVGGANRSQRSTDNSSTVFVRNLPFTTTDDQLRGFFGHFGKVRYARTVMDKATDRPAGTGFVCFFSEDDAKACIKAAPRPQPTATKTKHSILQDENADPEGKYTLDGRLLQVAQAVNKETAANLADSALVKRREKDKRRLFLLNEGSIGSNSPLYKLLGQQELQMRQASAAQRKKLVEKNPSLHLSLTRLAIRNLPRNVGSKELKELARKAIVGFAKDVKEGRRQPLSKEENARDSKEAREKERERKQKGKGIVRQATVVFESREGSKVPEKSGAGRSRGYGFIEYTSHHWALMGLRYLNGMQLEGDNGRKQRMIVEFAIENAQVVQRRRATENASSQKKPRQSENGAEDEGERTAKILKENKEARGKGGKVKKGKKGKKGAEQAEAEGTRKGEEKEEKFGMEQKLISRKRLMRKKKANARGKK